MPCGREMPEYCRKYRAIFKASVSVIGMRHPDMLYDHRHEQSNLSRNETFRRRLLRYFDVDGRLTRIPADIGRPRALLFRRRAGRRSS